MNSYIKQIGLLVLLLLTGLTTVSADQTAELLKVMNQAMLEPCNRPAYLTCLGLKQTFCRKQVGISVDLCNKKFPVKQLKADKQQFFQEFGMCMQSEIISRLKLDDMMLDKCEPILKSSLPKG